MVVPQVKVSSIDNSHILSETSYVDIDVVLEPLMEDIQKLWEHGVNVRDEYKNEHFNLNAIIFCMINDNPARLALTGQDKGNT
jgi:hypothetical protein